MPLSRRFRRPGLLGTALLVTVVLPVTLPAAPALASGHSGGHASEQAPTTVQVSSGQATMQRLAAEAARKAAARDDAATALAAAAEVSGAHLEAYSIAVRAQQQATVTEQAAEDQLQQAAQATDAERADLGAWARLTYQQGLGIGADPMVAAVLATRGQEPVTTLGVLRHLGQERSASLRTLQVAQARQRRLTDTAVAASQAPSAAAIQATDAQDAADAALARQRDLLGAADTQLAGSRSRLASARRAQLLAAGTGVPGATPGAGNAVSGKVGSCAGGDVQQYPNGKIPLAALCPLAANPKQHLRADAAYAFDQLNRAYALQFGGAACITDSYRPYAVQVRLFTTKPGLAAVPGTSNHGWGTAVDLCGGIQNYGTAQYRWMLVNAPLYGWFHPAWARKGAGREEPWHWEFGG